MEIGVRALRDRTAEVIDAVKAGKRVTLTFNGAPVADIVPYGGRPRWLFGAELRGQLVEGDRSADPGLLRELDELVGQTIDVL
ncbi:MAG: type II toxin-antitoxin system prevent-host-death family antitoxin [Solirubrobacteraceae bacterium]|jgi:prevent-host-death family protein